MLDFSNATKQQLLFLIFQEWEPLTLDEQYAIVRELRMNQLRDEDMIEFVRMYPKHDNAEIADYFGVSVGTVREYAQRIGLPHRLKKSQIA